MPSRIGRPRVCSTTNRCTATFRRSATAKMPYPFRRAPTHGQHASGPPDVSTRLQKRVRIASTCGVVVASAVTTTPYLDACPTALLRERRLCSAPWSAPESAAALEARLWARRFGRVRSARPNAADRRGAAAHVAGATRSRRLGWPNRRGSSDPAGWSCRLARSGVRHIDPVDTEEIAPGPLRCAECLIQRVRFAAMRAEENGPGAPLGVTPAADRESRQIPLLSILHRTNARGQCAHASQRRPRPMPNMDAQGTQDVHRPAPGGGGRRITPYT